tara:strand:+ start:1386 stop:1886 length:501 start_codon:yes stop_codon:yes gene_type:complete
MNTNIEEDKNKTIDEYHNKSVRHLQQLVEARKEIHETNLRADKLGNFANPFASLELITSRVEPILLKHNLLTSVDEKVLDNGQYKITMRIRSSETQGFVESSTTSKPDSQASFKVRSLHTYATRSLYRQLLALPIDNDDDGLKANQAEQNAEKIKQQNKNNNRSDL